MQPTHTRVNQSGISPTVRKAGTYRVTLDVSPPLRVNALTYVTTVYCHVYRNNVLITTVRDRESERAIREARRNVRLARKAGGL